MKNKHISFILVALLFGLSVMSQENSIDKNQEISINSLHEKLVLCTDRSIYAVNETVYFKAFYTTDKALVEYDWEARKQVSFNWSTVLYLELIKSDGTPLVQKKYPLNHNETVGKIQIPKELLSGTYYLKAYTKWMRNFSTNNYSYTQIKLINPQNSIILKASADTVTENKMLITTPQKSSEISLSTDKNIYDNREKVTVSIETNNKSFKEYEYCISVAKKGLNNLSVISSEQQNTISSNNRIAEYYPEINGISISGRVLNSDTKKPVENALVNLSILTNQSFLSVFNTNPKGEFFFNIPNYENTLDLFITATKDNLALSIEIDKDFCHEAVNLNSSEFILNEQEQILAKEIYTNALISESYANSNNKTDNISADTLEHSFYGIPKNVIYTEKYIDLPFLEEFIFELIPNISVMRKNNTTLLYPSQWNTLGSYPFLVMVDNIPTSDIETFLKIRTNKINRIEFVDNGYVIGDIKYSGIINAFSKDKDMAGIDLPKNSMFLTYNMFAENANAPIAVNNNQPVNRRTPDRRNCLYWNPSFKFNANSTDSISFYTSDSKGEYEIIIQTVINKNSKPIYTKKNIVVR